MNDQPGHASCEVNELAEGTVAAGELNEPFSRWNPTAMAPDYLYQRVDAEGTAPGEHTASQRGAAGEGRDHCNGQDAPRIKDEIAALPVVQTIRYVYIHCGQCPVWRGNSR